MDVSEEMLNDIEKKIAENSITNIETVLTEAGELNLENGEITFALISNVLHEVEDREKMLGDIKRLLGTGGRIAVIEWEKTDSEFGPPKDHRLGKADLAKMMEAVGFSDISFVDLGENFYGITAK
jgi:ubiquinone/menaquinone biosynthesis C-methylase UbiE